MGAGPVHTCAGQAKSAGCAGSRFPWRGLCWAAPGPTGTPLPKQRHLVVSHSRLPSAGDARLVIVGDVHGCAEELRELLKHVDFRDGTDTLVLVGDLVNKGPSSAEVVRLVRGMGALCVRGNHDDQLLEAWHRVGRYASGPEGYNNRHLLTELSDDELRWLQELPLTISFPWLKVIVVHAGLVPGIPLEQQSFRDLAWMRDVYRDDQGAWRGLQKADASKGSVPWVDAWEGPEHVVFGHDAKRKLQQADFATGLDTGCCYGYQLTALVIGVEDPSDHLLLQLSQVPALQRYSKPANAD